MLIIYGFYFHPRMIVLRRAFKKIDADGSGFLTREEILAAANNDVGLNVSDEKIADMLITSVKTKDNTVKSRLATIRHFISTSDPFQTIPLIPPASYQQVRRSLFVSLFQLK